MGTSYNIKLVGVPEGITLEQLEKDSALLLTTINNQMSTYQSDSELSVFNEAEVGTEVRVSSNLIKVVALAEKVSRLSEGRFDVTVGPLVNLWGFGPEFKTDELPDQAKIDAAKRKVGYQSIKLDSQKSSLKKEKSLYVDLSAIAKGFAVDEISRYLDAQRVTNYLVEIGGEVRVKGKKPDGEWRLAIEKPISAERSVHAVLQPKGKAVATSGDYRNYFDFEGQRYSHTIDPATGYPVKQLTLSATAIANTCAEADAFATAFNVMAPEQAIEVANSYNIAVLLLLKDGEGYRELANEAFKKYRVH